VSAEGKDHSSRETGKRKGRTKRGLNLREAADEVGTSVYRIRQMIREGTLRADLTTSRPLISRGELARKFPTQEETAPSPDLELLRTVIREEIREALRDEVRSALARLAGLRVVD